MFVWLHGVSRYSEGMFDNKITGKWEMCLNYPDFFVFVSCFVAVTTKTAYFELLSRWRKDGGTSTVACR